MSSFYWNNELIFELITMFEEKPELWDIASEGYKDRDKKQESWLEIAKAMNIDVNTVQRKMKMLMSQYRRELLRTNHSSKWFAFKKLSFLKTRQLAVLKTKQRPTCFVSVDREREVQKSKPHPQGDGQIRRIESARIEKVAVNDRISIIKEKGSGSQERDEYTAYGELVAMKLKKIGDSYARSTAQYHINNILYKAEIGEYDKRQKQSNSYKSREHVRAGSSSTPRHDSNYDEHSQISSSPTKSIDYNLKLENEDSDE